MAGICTWKELFEVGLFGGGDNLSHKLQQTPAKQNSGLNTAAGKFQNLQKQEQVSNNSARPPQIQLAIFN